MTTFDVGGMDKPLAVKKVRERAQKYIATMELLGKPASRVVLSVADYNALLGAVVKGRDKSLPPITELAIGKVRIEAAP